MRSTGDFGSLYRPLRGLARSHRDITEFKLCIDPVGAGAPAKRPVQATDRRQSSACSSPP
ncbi:hypothetical protein D0O09_04835 [Pseudomonas putida]|nr:hypothetical protein D0O09_04835 [Pseudomonas putida]